MRRVLNMISDDAISTILSNSCPAQSNGDVKTFILGGHCVEFTIKARYLGQDDFDKGIYEVLSIKMEPC